MAAAPGPPPAVPVGPTPGLPETTAWSLGKSRVISNGTDWSAVGNFTASDADKAKKWDTVAIVTLSVATLPSRVGENESLTNVECQITLERPPMVITAKGLLFGGSLGLMLSLNGTKNGKMAVPVLTMAEFNKERYGPKFAGIKVATPPKRFPVTDRCDCGDYDWYDWNWCISTLGSLGLNGLGTFPTWPFRNIRPSSQHPVTFTLHQPTIVNM